MEGQGLSREDVGTREDDGKKNQAEKGKEETIEEQKLMGEDKQGGDR